MASKPSRRPAESQAGLDDLVREARLAAESAYAPYSGFRVGAALEDSSGRIVTGANLENAAYPAGICAERAALLLWKDGGGSPLRRVVVYTPTNRPTPPCGLCREALLRWAPGSEVYLACRRGVTGPVRPEEWLPARGGSSK